MTVIRKGKCPIPLAEVLRGAIAMASQGRRTRERGQGNTKEIPIRRMLMPGLQDSTRDATALPPHYPRDLFRACP